MKKMVPCMILAGVVILFFSLCVPVSAHITEDILSNTEKNDGVISNETMEDLFSSNGLDYYAYMILEDAPETLKPVILEARSRIIVHSTWVDDDLDAWVTDEDGNVVEVIPHFSEVFPSDWENPVI